MKKSNVLGAVLGVIVLVAASTVLAASSANQTVTFSVSAINEFAVSGNPGTLTVGSAVAGSEPTAATDATTSYNVTTNGTNKKITGSIDSGMPANTSLQISLTAPTGGTSAGAVSLTTTAADLVTGITQIAQSGRGITYTFSANVLAGVIASDTRTVTLTLTDGS